MIRLLARLLRVNRAASGSGDDALGEYLRGCTRSHVTPEVLLQIL